MTTPQSPWWRNALQRATHLPGGDQRRAREREQWNRIGDATQRTMRQHLADIPESRLSKADLADPDQVSDQQVVVLINGLVTGGAAGYARRYAEDIAHAQAQIDRDREFADALPQPTSELPSAESSSVGTEEDMRAGDAVLEAAHADDSDVADDERRENHERNEAARWRQITDPEQRAMREFLARDASFAAGPPVDWTDPNVVSDDQARQMAAAEGYADSWEAKHGVTYYADQIDRWSEAQATEAANQEQVDWIRRYAPEQTAGMDDAEALRFANSVAVEHEQYTEAAMLLDQAQQQAVDASKYPTYDDAFAADPPVAEVTETPLAADAQTAADGDSYEAGA